MSTRISEGSSLSEPATDDLIRWLRFLSRWALVTVFVGIALLLVYFPCARYKTFAFRRIASARKERRIPCKTKKMPDYRKGTHTVYDIQYHFVWVTK
jgi:hypothetical protein